MPPHFIPLPLVVLLISLCFTVYTLLIFPPFFWPFSDPGFSQSGWLSSDGQNGIVRWLESRAGSAQRRKRVPAAASPSAGPGWRAGSAWGGDQLQVPNHPVTCGQPLLPPLAVPRAALRPPQLGPGSASCLWRGNTDPALLCPPPLPQRTRAGKRLVLCLPSVLSEF